VVVVSAISPYEETRRRARTLVEENAPFVEIHVATSLEVCAERDPKGLYKKALAGEITGFTGVDDPYEAPEEPELRVDTESEGPEESLQHVLDTLKSLGYIDDSTPMIEGDRVHSGLTDLRVTETGHVAKEA